MTPAATHRLGVILIAVTAVLWGTSGTAATFAPQVGPLAIGAAALGFGGLLQGIISIGAQRRAAPRLRAHAGVVAIGALTVAIYPLAFYSSMRYAGVAVGTVISLASAPLASGLLDRFIDHRRLGLRWTASAGLGVIGSVLLCLARGGEDAAGPGRAVLGVLLGLVAGATYAAYSWAAHRLIDAGIGRAASMGSVFGIGGLLLMPVLALTGAPILAGPGNLAVAAYMALVPMFLGYVLFGMGLVRVPASTATTVTLLEPAVSALLAVTVIGERLGALGWTGMAIIAAVLMVLATEPSSDKAGPVSGGASQEVAVP